MNARVAALLVVLLALFGGGALYYYHQARTQKPAGIAALGKPLLKDLKVASVASIQIREPQDALTLERKDSGWTLAERAGFPADFERVREFLVKAIELKVGQAEPLGAADRKRLKLDDAATRVEFRGADGKALATMLVGRKYFKNEPDNPDKAIADGRFVLIPPDDKTVYIVSDPLAQASAKSSDWISRTGFSAEKVKSLEYAPASGEGWKLERATEDADWTFAGAKGADKVEPSKANSAAYSLANVDLTDVPGKDLKPEQTGLATPTVLTAQTFDGLTYTLRLGALKGDSYYGTVAVAGEAKPQGKDAEERSKKIAERLPRERSLSAYTLLIPKSRVEDALKPRAELLARKDDRDEAPKKDAPKKDAPKKDASRKDKATKK
ncbi:MAG TPA: DUF4340 domain-containing protein [Burkholderiales bacterium]|jgi:hypothetical protein|nr:DUF4340 domain-containing protein [Burkholderiales bacterium]